MFESTPMPALLPIILTASHIVLVVDAVPKFNVEQTCRRAGEVSVSLGRSAGDCKRDEEDAHSKLHWAQYSPAQRAGCVRFSSLGSSPSYVELLTCLEMAKQAKELPEVSKMGTSGSASDQDFLPGGVLKELPDEPCICASL
ncbi:MAG TPA: hypothetical protein VFN63_14380 [Pseudolabrys sp.]|nr:hypothetical protein [Pseudolabrys sp.]